MASRRNCSKCWVRSGKRGNGSELEANKIFFSGLVLNTVTLSISVCRRCCYFACSVSPVSPRCFNPVIEINGILQPLKEHSSAETNCSHSYLPSPLSRCSIFSISVLTEARFRWSVLLRHAPFSSARTTFFFPSPPPHFRQGPLTLRFIVSMVAKVDCLLCVMYFQSCPDTLQSSDELSHQ